jgi:hypothetical protein
MVDVESHGTGSDDSLVPASPGDVLIFDDKDVVIPADIARPILYISQLMLVTGEQ